MSSTVRTGLVYGVLAAAALVVGLVLDSGLLVLVAGLVVVVGVVHLSRGGSARIEDAQARAEATAREGNAPPEGHGGW